MAIAFNFRAYWKKRPTHHFNLQRLGDLSRSESGHRFLYKSLSSVFGRSLRSKCLELTGPDRSIDL